MVSSRVKAAMRGARWALPSERGPVAAHAARFGFIGVLGGELLTRFIPEMVLRKIAAVLFVGMGVLMWFEKL